MELRQVLPPDAIPSIDDPSFARTHVGADDDEVVVLDFHVDSDRESTLRDRAPRAYPVRILDFHEIVNDVVGDVPVAVTWCPLCGSAVVYDRRVAGERLTFGVSGKLADDDLVMYDRETGSEWKQSTGRCLTGVFEDEQLAVVASALMRWETFTERYDDGVVLQPPGTKSEAASDTDEPAVVDYDQRPYDGYLDAEGFGLDAHRGTGGRNWSRADDLSPKTVVLGVALESEAGDHALGFPLPRVRDAGGVATADIGGEDVVVMVAGTQLFGYRDETTTGWERREGELIADGTTWNPETGESADGRRLDRLPTRRLFAFTWQDDHGPDAFWQPRQSGE